MDVNNIKRIEIKNLWGKYNYQWKHLNPDVNILVGINGSGKTTILNIIEIVSSNDKSQLKKYPGIEVFIEFSGHDIHYPNGELSNVNNKQLLTKISTFDIPVKQGVKKKLNDTQLDQELDYTIYQRKTDYFSFTDYRLRATNLSTNVNEINNRIIQLFNIIDRLFERTGKKIEIDSQTNLLQFKIGDSIIQLNQLSSGEKQLLIILFRVFLMDNQPFILLMDEPEISLHIEWQQQLIDVIRNLNPNCQIIISTHSPSIFGKGWGDKLFYMEDLQTQ